MKLKHKMVVSECGAVCSEELARHLDTLHKSLPAECTFRRLGQTEDLTLDAGSRCDISTVTNSAVDKVGEVVDAKGVDLSHYQANPIVLFGHDSDKPCGKAQWIKQTPTGIVAKSHYPARPEGYEGEWLPDFVWAMVQAGVLKGKSIGFLPLEFRQPSKEEEEKGCQLVITKSLLAEYSVVSVPMNGEALVQAISKGVHPQFISPTWKLVGKARKKAPPPDYSKIEIDAEAIARRVVEQARARWGV